MRTSWADAVENVATGSFDNAGTSGGTERQSAPTKPAYVPPHLRNRTPASEPPAPSLGGLPSGNDRSGYGGPTSGSRWAVLGLILDVRDMVVVAAEAVVGVAEVVGVVGIGRSTFGNDDVETDAERVFNEQENTGINFDAYEDIPVETSGDNVPPPVNTFADIDLGMH
ncbi:hypothetical protein DH2020_039421 [Rehmannia glutinosa]|uniref:Uncharacterized protein n=1 Tax=Rehmannia glutinosa TaxID=99300 RepID=A0ABR0UX07_REHGL